MAPSSPGSLRGVATDRPNGLVRYRGRYATWRSLVRGFGTCHPKGKSLRQLRAQSGVARPRTYTSRKNTCIVGLFF
eukprot:10605615-Karenia_brevis.AAC.1